MATASEGDEKKTKNIESRVKKSEDRSTRGNESASRKTVRKDNRKKKRGTK